MTSGESRSFLLLAKPNRNQWVHNLKGKGSPFGEDWGRCGGETKPHKRWVADDESQSERTSGSGWLAGARQRESEAKRSGG